MSHDFSTDKSFSKKSFLESKLEKKKKKDLKDLKKNKKKKIIHFFSSFKLITVPTK